MIKLLRSAHPHNNDQMSVKVPNLSYRVVWQLYCRRPHVWRGSHNCAIMTWSAIEWLVWKNWIKISMYRTLFFIIFPRLSLTKFTSEITPNRNCIHRLWCADITSEVTPKRWLFDLFWGLIQKAKKQKEAEWHQQSIMEKGKGTINTKKYTITRKNMFHL